MTQNPIELIQPHIDNSVDPAEGKRAVLTGIFGDRPSVYAKSPILWNAAYRSLDIDGVFLPFDVSEASLPGLVETLRQVPAFAGGSVTVPYKTRIMDLLDDVDVKARQIGAVNTVARDSDGRLVGYNTDAQGAIDSLTKRMPWQERPFLAGLEGLRVLLIGAGGAGRAVAFALGEEIGQSGQLIITNRTAGAASDLAANVNRDYGNTISITEEDIPTVLPDVKLIVNASLRGQSGLRQAAIGQVTCLEPYCSLAAANPLSISENQYPDTAALYRAWYRGSFDDICGNRSVSGRTILKADPSTLVVDIIYSPLESALLGQARLAGLTTLNGKGMNLAQAVDGFVNRAMGPFIHKNRWDLAQVYDKVFDAMAQVW